MRLTFDGLIPGGDLECLKRLGEDWNREIVYIPVFHPVNDLEIERMGYSGKPVKVTVRIEILEEENAETDEPDSQAGTQS